MHLSGFADGLRVGYAVSKGEVIAYMGSTGRSTGTHLDFRLIYEGTYTDPCIMYSNAYCGTRQWLKGNSTFIDLGDKKILIDVGFSYKQIKEKLSLINVDPHEIDALLITHDHTDHTYGLKVFLNKVKPTLFITPEVENFCLEKSMKRQST